MTTKKLNITQKGKYRKRAVSDLNGQGEEEEEES